jgi:hypothetical protein
MDGRYAKVFTYAEAANFEYCGALLRRNEGSMHGRHTLNLTYSVQFLFCNEKFQFNSIRIGVIDGIMVWFLSLLASP